MSEHEPTLRVVDGLGHDLPSATADVRRQMIEWLDLEDAVGESSPGLRTLRDLLAVDEESDA